MDTSGSSGATTAAASAANQGTDWTKLLQTFADLGGAKSKPGGAAGALATGTALDPGGLFNTVNPKQYKGSSMGSGGNSQGDVSQIASLALALL